MLHGIYFFQNDENIFNYKSDKFRFLFSLSLKRENTNEIICERYNLKKYIFEKDIFRERYFQRKVFLKKDIFIKKGYFKKRFNSQK